MHKCKDEFKEYHCYFTRNRSFRDHPMTRAVFFYGTDFSVFDLPLPRHENEDWALIHEESPKNNPLISQYNIIRMFNHTATFKSQSDLPLTLQYLESLDVITDEVRYEIKILRFNIFFIILIKCIMHQVVMACPINRRHSRSQL